MRFTCASALVSAALLVGGPSAFAGQSLLKQPQPKVSRNPYSQLFAVPSADTKAPSQAKPKVVCGMTIIPGDSTIDRGIQMRREQTDTRHSMRVIEPPVCR